MSATAVATFLVAGILAASGAVGWPLAIAFSVFMLVQIQARLLLIAAYLRQDPPDHEWRKWSRRFTAGVIASSLGLAAFSWGLLAPDLFHMQLLVLLYLCAVAGSSIKAFGVLRPAIQIAILPVLLVPAIWMLTHDDRLHWALAAVVLVWMAVLMFLAQRLASRFQQSMRRRHEVEFNPTSPPSGDDTR